MGQADKQYDGQLIDEYYRLRDLKAVALKENAAETVKLIERMMQQIKLKLQPTELPD